MLWTKFNKFYSPYFINSDLTVTPIAYATVAQANSCEFLSEFDWSAVENLPLKELFLQLVKNIPFGTVFLTPGPKADILHRFFQKMFAYLGRNDIKFLETDGNMTPEFVKFSSEKYFCHNSWLCHCLYKMHQLVNQNTTVGMLGPFPTLSKIETHWVVSEQYYTIPCYLFGQDYPELTIPNLTLPLLKAFIAEVNLAEFKFNEFGSGVLAWLLLKKFGLDSNIFDNTFFDIDAYHRYELLINRNWADPTYYPVQNFQ